MTNRQNAAQAVRGDVRAGNARRKAPYWNLHGGAPGKAPAMSKDFHTDREGTAVFDRLNDPDARYRSRMGDAA